MTQYIIFTDETTVCVHEVIIKVNSAALETETEMQCIEGTYS